MSKRKRILCNLLSAILILFILAMPVSAEMRNGYVSNLLSPLYGGAQTQLVDGIGRPVNASCTVGDYILTADAVIGDRYNAAIVYTLSRVDGAPMPADIEFKDWEPAFSGRASGGGSLSPKLNPARTKLRLVEQWTTTYGFSRHRRVSPAFMDLISGDELLQEGTWELNFAARYEDSSIRVPAGLRKVCDVEGLEYRLNRILLSPVGIHIDFTAPNPYLNGIHNRPYFTEFNVSLLLRDGTVLPMKDANKGFHSKQDNPTVKADYGAMFDEPVPLEEIEALLICDAAIPLRTN